MQLRTLSRCKPFSCVLATGLALGSGASQALDAGLRMQPRPALSLDADTTVLDTPAGPQRLMAAMDPAARQLPAQELRARWTPGQKRIGFVAGADLTKLPGSNNLRPVLGMRADLSDEARLVYELRGNPSSTVANDASADRTRWAFELKPAQNAAQRLRGGLFRVQLSGNSTLLLRPRSGGLSVTWRSQF